jgi:hypothetical protein
MSGTVGRAHAKAERETKKKRAVVSIAEGKKSD